MARTGDRPYTLTRKPEPPADSSDWVIWAAWADRVSFDEIRERTGLDEQAVIRVMRRELKPSSFRRWRKRASGQTTKHRQRFMQSREGAAMNKKALDELLHGELSD
ncbi:TIGR03643 family protein [Congregibacter variabilis]|uniref:TIGR03643 family protein n=1 Tax=Congregibacter variabilis TaxID=3081200 RepID=A0ABZ0HZ93_9GAMM|nr:TIGR03643 family protein [Congregibacter sp. IMCC43200]